MAAASPVSPVTKSPAAPGRRLQKWAPSLETGVDGFPHWRRVPEPEYCRILSSSQSGRSNRKLRKIERIFLQPPKPPPQAGQIVDQERLIYLALYRDKVAQQQAKLQKARDGASPTGRDAQDLPLSPREEPASAITRLEASPTRPAGREAKALRVAASVMAKTTRGVDVERTEAHWLGRLFDEWRALQEEEGLDFERPTGTRSRHGALEMKGPSNTQRVSTDLSRLGTSGRRKEAQAAARPKSGTSAPQDTPFKQLPSSQPLEVTQCHHCGAALERDYGGPYGALWKCSMCHGEDSSDTIWWWTCRGGCDFHIHEACKAGDSSSQGSESGTGSDGEKDEKRRKKKEKKKKQKKMEPSERLFRAVTDHRINCVNLAGGELDTLRQLPAFVEAIPTVRWHAGRASSSHPHH